MGDLISGIWGEKPWYKSLTSWGLVVLVGVTSLLDEACAQGILLSGTCDMANMWLERIGIVMTALGIRRASNTVSPSA
tara:strand:+ start:247 stop:480 length:234 start_codon:yes stop_codon:yes gene_type:complete